MGEIVSVFAQLQSGQRLPSPKGVVLRLIELAQQEEASLAQVTRLVQADPALAGRLVRAANSVALAPARPVVATGDAILRLGLPSVFQLALAFSLVSQYRGGDCHGFDYDRYWSRSLLQGVAARALALRQRLLPPEEGFVCGLLARVGCLALATAWPDRYGEVHAHGHDALERREREAFSVTHWELTGCLLGHWGFPRPLIEAIVAHERPEEAAGDRKTRIARLLRLAGRLADLACGNEAGRAEAHGRASAEAATLGLEAEAFDGVVTEIDEAWRAWCPVFELDPAAASFETFQSAAANDEPPPVRSAKGLRLMVIQSDAAEARNLAALLADNGHEVRIGHGTDVLAKLVGAGCDAVLIDWDRVGSGTCEMLRRTHAGRRLHVIALGTQRDESAIGHAIEAGADDYLAKPYSPRALEARLASFARVARTQRELSEDLDRLTRLSSDLEARNRRLQAVARTDEATGLARREAGLADLQAAARRGGGACLLVDIDDLKPVNARHGRLAGDRAIVHVARLVMEAAPPGAIAARYGGDEFLVILPGLDAAAGLRAGGTIAECIAATPLALRGESVALTVSVGLAPVPRDENAGEIAQRAFEAACSARRQGGNRACAWGDSGAL